MSAFFTQLAEFAPDVGATLLVRGSAILLAAVLLVRLLARASAATRYGVWSLAFVVLAALPLAAGALPRWTVTAPLAGPPVRHAVHPSADPPPPAPTASTAVSHAVSHPVTAAPVRARSQTSPALGLAVLAWMAGAALLLARLATHTLLAAGLVRRATPVRPGRVATMLRELGRPSGRVVLSDETVVPLVAGLRRPTVVLPCGAVAWPSELLRSVLAHEMAHVERRDYAMHLVTRIGVALYWPNPLVWLGARRMAAERERSCDDRALEVNAPQAYASHLVEVAVLLSGGGTLSAPLAMAGRRALQERIQSIIAFGVNRRPLSRARLFLGAVVLAAVAVPVTLIATRRAPAPDPYLMTALQDPDVPVRLRAAWGLGEFESRADN